MIRRIDKAEAQARLAAQIAPGECAICALVAGRIGDPRDVIAETPEAKVVLTQYPSRWGHMLVVTRAHVTSFTAVDDATHDATMRLAREAARRLERTMKPARVFVASLGCAHEGLPATSPHLHVHVVPVMDPDARPRDVLTWENGIDEGDAEEWAALRARLRGAG
ncbi:MAG: HIT family protein [Sandaracinus sp.]